MHRQIVQSRHAGSQAGLLLQQADQALPFECVVSECVEDLLGMFPIFFDIQGQAHVVLIEPFR